MKTYKLRTFLLVERQRGVNPRDVLQHFGYSRGTAPSYLSCLGRQSLVDWSQAKFSTATSEVLKPSQHV